MANEVKTNWTRIILIAAAAILVIWLSGRLQSCGNHTAAIEALYQEVQATHDAVLAIRRRNIKKVETAQAATATAYQARLDQLTADADAEVKALKWKSNEQLTKEKASVDEVKIEKKKVEDALDVMTKNRDDLKTAAENREKEIAEERIKLKAEYDGALKTIQEKLDSCEKARKFALDEGGRKTWATIGPSAQVHVRQGQIVVDYGVSLQIPVVVIKSPFKRF